jgi:hypothetical protein
MDIDVFPRPSQDIVFRVLRTALSREHTLEDRERLFLDTYARITGYALPSAEPRTIHPSEVEIGGAHQRKRLVQLAAVAALLSHPIRPASIRFVADLAHQLRTHDPVIEVMHALAGRRHFRVRVLAMRRAMRALFTEAWLHGGLRGVLGFAGAMFLGAAASADRLWSYKRLELLPEGTLGRAYWRHMTDTGFRFPGEKGGIPGPVAYHDVAHVLAEHDTTPLGEIQQGSFQAGNRRKDGFFFLQFVLLQFHHGVKITPSAPPRYGQFQPDKVLWAIHRGAQCPVDMTHQWDFWPLMPLPIEQARAQCGLLPKLPAAA